MRVLRRSVARRRATALLVALVGLAAATSAGVAGEDPGAGAMQALFLHCDDGFGDAGAMESGYLEEGCWGHVGHHTWLAGREGPWLLHGGRGKAFVTEQQLSPPVEGLGVDVADQALLTPVVLEVSMDGREWRRVQDARYTFVDLQEGLPSPQDVFFDFTADGEAFRHLRIRMPLSAAHGLSGYIDFSELTLDLQAGPAAAPPDLVPVEGRQLTCLEDILEDVWRSHPCTFGAVEHWDAPSFFHTYPLGGPAALDRIEGTAVLAYFRPDDPGTCCGQTEEGVLDGELLVQVSAGGEAFATVAEVPVTYGVPVTFDVPSLDGTEAQYVRLVSGKHPGYWNHPALKHPEAFLVFSEVRLGGMLPEA